MSDAESEDGPPDFEDPFSHDDVERQVYAVVLQTREPTAVSAIAERAECDPKTARKYLDWFAQLGIVREHEGRPTTYERNDSYFEWRRINRLAAEYTREELQAEVRALTERIQVYERQYDAGAPAEIDAIAAAESDEHGSIDDVYGDLGDWATALQERRYHERARQQLSSANDTEQASG